ncbi:hypothetical protein [Pseudomarimonas arenosa]|uniref:Sel1 repeat family protein n=1 Tax=Pseudomarimonas arenosa TaxID=2774145 RepID=A0AAW3ZKF9_9GAMM|nr:hypothetical protein [Pseudomarimonas arenosa]MBD8526501.1 hypothetical protein [Pseudomarimonas arenosa]
MQIAMKMFLIICVLAAVGLVFYLTDRSPTLAEIKQPRPDGVEATLPDDPSAKPTVPAERDRNVSFAPSQQTAPLDEQSQEEFSEEWLSRQSVDIRASYISGYDLKGHDTFLSYFNALESAWTAGDHSVAPELAQLYRRCQRALLSSSAGDPNSPGFFAAQACSTLPDRGLDYSAELLDRASLAGNDEATLSLLTHPRRDVAMFPTSAESIAWARQAIERLESLAQRGNVGAHLELANAYLSDRYGLRDLERSRRSFGIYIQLAPPSDPRRRVAELTRLRLCQPDPVSPTATQPGC